MSSAAVELRATQQFEAWYEHRPRGGWKEAATNGLPRVSDPDDPVWDGEFAQRDPVGCLRVARTVRVDGRIVETEDIHGGPCHPNVARTFLREFARRTELGQRKPWQQETYYADLKEQAEKAKQEGRAADLAVLAEMFKAAMGGGPESVAPKPTVTAPSAPSMPDPRDAEIVRLRQELEQARKPKKRGRPPKVRAPAPAPVLTPSEASVNA